MLFYVTLKMLTAKLFKLFYVILRYNPVSFVKFNVAARNCMKKYFFIAEEQKGKVAYVVSN